MRSPQFVLPQRCKNCRHCMSKTVNLDGYRRLYRETTGTEIHDVTQDLIDGGTSRVFWCYEDSTPECCTPVFLDGIYRYQHHDDDDPEYIEVKVKETKSSFVVTVTDCHGLNFGRYTRFTTYVEQTFGDNLKPGKRLVVKKSNKNDICRLRIFDTFGHYPLSDTGFQLNKLIFHR